MSDELVITVAPCGAETTRDHNPAVPFTPAEIAAEARRSFEAGARMIHVHARWDDGTPTQDSDRYRETVAAIREQAPEMIVQVSTGGAAGTPANVTLLAGRLPEGATWSATGIGRSHLPVVMTAIAAGGHVRLGFEDQVEYERAGPRRRTPSWSSRREAGRAGRRRIATPSGPARS